MINVLDTIKQTILVEEFNLIDANIICESLNCKLLQDLARQLKDIKAEKQKEIDKEYEQKKAKWGGDPYKDSNYNKTFKEIFGSGEVRWDKITDADISKIPAGDDNELSRQERKQILDVIQSKKDAVIIIKDKEDKEFLYCIYTWGYIYQLTKGHTYYSHAGEHLGHRGARGQFKDLTNNEKIDLCKGKNIYFIELDKTQKEEMRDLRRERSLAKSGIVMLDPESLKRMAQQNVERYKEIIRKNKASRLDNDELITKAKKIINQAASYAAMVAKDPVRHADVLSLVSDLTLYIYDKKRYNEPNRYRKQGYYSGVNGILPMLMSYAKLVKDVSTDGRYEHQERELKTTQEELKKAVEKSEEILHKIEDKINE